MFFEKKIKKYITNLNFGLTFYFSLFKNDAVNLVPHLKIDQTI